MLKTKTINNNNILTLINVIKTNDKFSNTLQGVVFQNSGRLRGVQRARKLRVSHGKIKTQSFNSSLQFSKKQIFTK